MDLVDGCVKFEEQVGQNLQVVADSIYLLQAYFRVSKSWQQEIVGKVHFLMEISCWFEIISSFGCFLSGYFPEEIQADLAFLLLEAVTLLDEDMILPFDLFIEMHIFEIFAEKLTHDIIVNIVLGEVFNNFFALLQIILGVQPDHFLQENFSHKFIVNSCVRNSLDKSKDLDYFLIPVNKFKQSLGKFQCKWCEQVVSKDIFFSLYLKICGNFEISVYSLEILEGQFVNIAVEDIGYELLLSCLGLPVGADQVDVAGLDDHLPLLEDLDQFQLRQLPVFEGLVGLWQNIKNISNLSLDFLVKSDGVISVDGI